MEMKKEQPIELLVTTHKVPRVFSTGYHEKSNKMTKSYFTWRLYSRVWKICDITKNVFDKAKTFLRIDHKYFRMKKNVLSGKLYGAVMTTIVLELEHSFVSKDLTYCTQKEAISASPLGNRTPESVYHSRSWHFGFEITICWKLILSLPSN